VENAFILYSNGGESAIQAPGWNESYGRFQDAYERLISVAPSPESIDVNDDVDTLKLFVKAYQEFDKSLGAIQVYSEFDEEVFEQQYGLRPEVIESYHGKYENALEKIREQIDEDEEDDLTIDFDYQLSEVGKQQIDYEYLMLLMQTIVNEPDSQNRIKRIVDAEAYLTKFKDNNPKLGEIIEDIFSTIKDGNELAPAEDTINVASEIEKRIDERVSELVHGLSENLYVQEDDLHYLIENYKPEKAGKQTGENNLLENMDKDRYLEENREKVQKKFRVKKFAKQEYTDVIESEILPLTNKNF
ncbi:MAG: DEAD/DEAH box helicase, partial [Aerococcus viridans]